MSQKFLLQKRQLNNWKSQVPLPGSQLGDEGNRAAGMLMNIPGEVTSCFYKMISQSAGGGGGGLSGQPHWDPGTSVSTQNFRVLCVRLQREAKASVLCRKAPARGSESVFGTGLCLCARISERGNHTSHNPPYSASCASGALDLACVSTGPGSSVVALIKLAAD